MIILSNQLSSLLYYLFVYRHTLYDEHVPEHLSSPPVFIGVRGWCYSVFSFICMFCLSFCLFSFGHCVFCISSIYGFWLPFWYLQTLIRSEAII